jgi:hypothetical protein
MIWIAIMAMMTSAMIFDIPLPSQAWTLSARQPAANRPHPCL